jgi:glycosyltransferase involved in cell wall biosynthesis
VKKTQLSRLDTKMINLGLQDIIVISTVRNELLRLPYWLQYYRQLGVKQFFFVDDHSTDGTTAFLLEQPDAYVFNPHNTYSEAGMGLDWQNALLDEFAIDHWALILDADELLVYHDSENRPLIDFCAEVEQEGADSVFSFMLDMYPDYNLSDAHCEPGKAFYDVCPFFDKDYDFIEFADGYAALKGWQPTIEVIGGPRMRKFYPEQRDVKALNRWKNRMVWRGYSLAEKLGCKFRDRPHHAPTLYKVPLFKWEQNGIVRPSPHHIIPSQKGLSSKKTALLHFKFFSDFHNKAKLETSRGEHYGGGQEYRRYLSHIAQNPDISFMYEGSTRFKSSKDLLAYGLITP